MSANATLHREVPVKLLKREQNRWVIRTSVTCPGRTNCNSRREFGPALAVEALSGGSIDQLWDRSSEVEEAFRDSGGVLSGDAFVLLLRERMEQPISQVAKWIVSGRVLSFTSSLQTMLPLFQFDLASMQPRPVVGEIIAELRGALEDREVVEWFVRRNCSLQGGIPANLLRVDPGAVYEAARVDRYVTRGC